MNGGDAPLGWLCRLLCRPSEDQLEREALYEGMFLTNNAVKLLIDPDDGHIVDANPAAAEFYGYPLETLKRMRIIDINALPEQEVHAEMARARAKGKLYFEFPHRLANGEIRQVEVHSGPVDLHGRRLLFSIIHDITERWRAERRVRRLSNFYAALSQTNQAIVRIDDIGELYGLICRIAATYGELRAAWIGLVDDDGNTIRIAAEYGLDPDFLTTLRISRDAGDPQGRGPSGTALRENRHEVWNDFLAHPDAGPWREEASRCDYRAVAAFPLRREGRPVGSLSFYAGEVDFFDDELVALLEEMATDISFAMDNRLREQRRQQAEAELRLAAKVFESNSEGIMITDPQTRILSVNRAFTELTGYAAEEVLGKNPNILSSGRHDHEFYRAMWHGIDTLGHWEGEIWNRRRDGEIFPQWIAISALHDDNGRLTHYIGISSDIAERKAYEERLQYLAHHDPLTGLPNHVLLRDRVEQALTHAEHTGQHVALLYLDLDRFKLVNESLGHPVGDQLIQAVVKRIRPCLHDTDTVSRQGGDEFLIALTEQGDNAAVAHTAQTLLERIAEPIEVDGHSLSMSASIGVSVFPEDGRDFDTLFRQADAALNEAKDAGRNTHRFFTHDMNANALERLQLEHSLRLALERGEFALHYQPQVALDGGRIIGAEALLRWHDPDTGLVPPGRFIGIAEDSGLIVPIGAWVLTEACRQNRAWRDAGLPPIPLAVNLSALQFRRDDLVESVTRALDDSGLEADGLELELTESILIHDQTRALETLQRLKQLGIGLAIDDFGTGYSSLAYLRRFAVDKLKIDQSFVRDIATDPDDAAIVRAVIQLGRSLGLRTVAEGVETAEQAAFLRREGCDEAQGYHFGRPLPVDEFTRLLEHGRLPYHPD
ncbi:MAG: EAL domain-containing protein [Chromatiales bacterium]|jgi:diguanylate cyclase (GGDEF)-like protein/PAS domain S-box-containing protein|nr:EAL domain-containing protein [Chromatiales bacterium]MDX9767162.1 EAL domain-containing protein [Ectothiorhodospiraceae bacterium]